MEKKIKAVEWLKETAREFKSSIDTLMFWWKYEREFFWQNISARIVVMLLKGNVGADSLGENVKYGDHCILSEISYNCYSLGQEQIIMGRVGIMNGKVGIVYVDSCCHPCLHFLFDKDFKVNGTFFKLTERVIKVFSNAGMGMTNILGVIGKVESDNVENIEEVK